MRWHDGTQVWITPFTREAKSYGLHQQNKDTCSLMSTKSILHRQTDPEKRHPLLNEEALRQQACDMGIYHPSMIYHSGQEGRIYTYNATLFSELPNLWRSLGTDGQYIGIRCQQQDVNQIAERTVEMMALFHNEGHDLAIRRGYEQLKRDAEGKNVLAPSEAIKENDNGHTVPFIGFAYRYEEGKTTDNELVGAVMNESHVGAFLERFPHRDELKKVKHPHLGAGMAIDRHILQAQIFSKIPRGLRLNDGHDCVMQLAITERAIPRF